MDVVVGYTGGRQKNPTYSNIMDSTEAFLVEFDPSVISYEAILDEVSSVLVIWASYYAVIRCDTYSFSIMHSHIVYSGLFNMHHSTRANVNTDRPSFIPTKSNVTRQIKRFRNWGRMEVGKCMWI